MRAGLTTAELPVFGPDGMPRLQQVALKDLLPEKAAESPAAIAGGGASPERSSSAADPTPSSVAKSDVPRDAELPASDSKIHESPVEKDHTGGSDSGGDAVLSEDLDISPERLHQEVLAYETTLGPNKALSSELHKRARDETASQWYPPNSLPRHTGASAPTDSEVTPSASAVTAKDVDSFFSQSEATLIAALRKGRSKRDDAYVAAEEEEIHELIQRDRDAALQALAGTGKDVRSETAEGDSSPNGDSTNEAAYAYTEGEEESLGDVTHSEVLQTIRERLREDPELEGEVKRLGESPEALAKKVQAILRHVTSKIFLLNGRYPARWLLLQSYFGDGRGTR